MNCFDTISSLIGNKHTAQGVLFAELTRETYLLAPSQPFPTLSQIIMYIVVLRGTMNITIDNIRHESTAQTKNLINIKPINTVSDLRVSDDFRGYVLVVSRQFMEDVEHRNKPISFYDIVAMRSHHALTLDKNDVEIISDYYHIMEKNNDRFSSPLDISVFKFAVQLCHLKILQRIFTAKERGLSKTNATRASMLCDRFFAMIEQSIEKEHAVGYYSDALNITSHYLTKITNSFIGLPANRIITNELISRASILLRNPEYTLQQIADRLNFYDQSSFGKFFKKHTGKTPTAYRKESNH